MPLRTWKTHPLHSMALELLGKKGAMTDADLFDALKEECEDMGFKDFNEMLMRLEVTGKIRTTSTAKGKRRIEAIS